MSCVTNFSIRKDKESLALQEETLANYATSERLTSRLLHTGRLNINSQKYNPVEKRVKDLNKQVFTKLYKRLIRAFKYAQYY